MNETVLQGINLTVGYAQRAVLADVSFAIGPGEFVGLVGANGAGKSTLVKTLRGLVPALGGSVQLLGRDIRELAPRTFAQQAAYLAQNTEFPFA